MAFGVASQVLLTEEVTTQIEGNDKVMVTDNDLQQNHLKICAENPIIRTTSFGSCP